MTDETRAANTPLSAESHFLTATGAQHYLPDLIAHA
jgi:hypothetical protein